MVHHRQTMDVDLPAITHAYGPDAEEYARKFGEDLVTNEFDRNVVDEVIAGLAPRALVLDIGCGPAQVSAHVREAGHAAVSIDLTMEMLLVARSRGAANSPVRADVQRLAIADGVADAAVCWYSLHHLPRAAMPGVLAELRRVLCVGGRLVIGTHGGGGEEFHATEWQGRPETVIVTYYAEQELRDLVRRAAFGDVRAHRRGPLPHEHQVDKLYVIALAV